MIVLEENSNYKIDFDGNIYGPKGLQKGSIDKGFRAANIPTPTGKDRKISRAKLVAKYLVDNPKNYKRYAFKDGNPLNCHPTNIVFISPEIDNIKRKFHINGIGNNKGKTNTAHCAVLYSQTDELKQFYMTGDKKIIDNIFIEIWQTAKDINLKKVLGILYIKVWEMLERKALLYCPRKLVLSVYKKFIGYENMHHCELSLHYH
jgi:hypothetical protein